MSFSDRLKKFLAGAWEYIKVARIELIVLFGALALDLIVKSILGATMNEGDKIVVIPNFFNIYFIFNKNAAFGFDFGLGNLVGEFGTRVIFLILTVFAVALFAVFMYKARGKSLLGRIGLALIIGGALGNFVDRLFLGYVRDFAQIVFFGLDLPLLGSSFAVFNIADVALVVGVIMFIIYFIFFYTDEVKEKEKAKADGTEYELIEGEQNSSIGSGVDMKTAENEVVKTEEASVAKSDEANVLDPQEQTDKEKMSVEGYAENSEKHENSENHVRKEKKNMDEDHDIVSQTAEKTVSETETVKSVRTVRAKKTPKTKSDKKEEKE